MIDIVLSLPKMNAHLPFFLESSHFGIKYVFLKTLSHNPQVDSSDFGVATLVGFKNRIVNENVLLLKEENISLNVDRFN